jgi:pyruvate/2-oxoglutarate dehydrogenase complex dihydrolipoamide dehydrogenase (E3) component
VRDDHFRTLVHCAAQEEAVAPSSGRCLGAVVRFPRLYAHTTDETRGFMKALIGSDDRILGFTMIGAEAGEVMTSMQTAMLAKK